MMIFVSFFLTWSVDCRTNERNVIERYSVRSSLMLQMMKYHRHFSDLEFQIVESKSNQYELLDAKFARGVLLG